MALVQFPYPEKQRVIGVPVSVVNMEATLDVLDHWVQSRTRSMVCVRDAHGIVRCQTDLEFLRIHHEAGLVVPDGMPVLRLLSSAKGQAGRVRGADLVRSLCERSVAKGYRHFFYGGAPGIADELAAKLQADFPGLLVAGTYCPPFRDLTGAEENEIIAMINAAAPDIVWVGLSTPRQEFWMRRVRAKLEAPALLGVGAAYDFLTGKRKEASSWIQKSGFEWLYRACSEPKRLGKRYLEVVPKFLAFAILERLGLYTPPVLPDKTGT